MRNFWASLPLVFLLCSCTITRPAPAVVDGELIHHPQILTDPAFPTDQMSLWGVKLGDSATAIPASRIHSQGTQGWIWCRDGSRYRAADGVIIALGLWNQKAIQKLDIRSPDDIQARFGPTSTIDVADPLRIYRYREGKLAVIWNDREQQVNAINISR